MIEFRFIPAHAGNGNNVLSIDKILHAIFGSSPRMRGTLVGTRSLVNHVHKSVHPRACGEHEIGEDGIQTPLGKGTVHPRACGEHGVHRPVQRSSHSRRGSSPRMRGTRHIDHRLGSMPPESGSSPRMRGTGHILRRLVIARRSAVQSPRMRGTAQLSQSFSVSGIYPVHPRACGEHEQERRAPRALRIRFIPAHAGNTCRSIPIPVRVPEDSVHPRACGEHSNRPHGKYMAMSTVHPRACGEHPIGIRPETCHSLTGSSPRMRGAHPQECRYKAERADSSCACGESMTVIPSIHGIGSSPRMRGTRFRWYIAADGDTQHSVHPRACGERQWSAATMSFGVGRPVHPRACGERRMDRTHRLRLGPAVHPRACGERHLLGRC